MKPTDILSHEHRVIEQVLDCLEQMADRYDTQGTLNLSDAQDAIAFFRTFADECHHGKEEAHLFPALEAKGFPRTGGPTGVMLSEHTQGRAFVRGMSAALDAVAGGEADAAGRFVQNARGYIELLRQHIHKEDHCLFTMVNQVFTDADQQRLREAFASVESEHMGVGTHEKYLRLAHDLAERYGVARQVCHEEGHDPGVLGALATCSHNARENTTAAGGTVPSVSAAAARQACACGH
jgi:hemerythrin-like domain-containing protein